MLRSLLAALLVLALVPAAALANTSVWASRTVLDRGTFRATVVAALDDPDLKGQLTVRLTRELYGALIDADDEARLLLGQALGLGEDPSDRQVIGELQPLVAAALDDPRATTVRDMLVDDVHATLRGADAPSGQVRLVDEHFVVNVQPMIDAIIRSVDMPGSAVLVATLPGVPIEVALADAPGLGAARDGLATLERAALVLPLVALLAALLVVLVAHRRARAVGIVGAAAVIAGLVGIGVVLLGGVAIARSGADLNPALVDGTIGVYSGVLLVQSAMLVGAGLVLTFIGSIAAGRGGRRPVPPEEEW